MMRQRRRRPGRITYLGCAPGGAGGKARNLEWLSRRGARVPRTWVLCDPAEAGSIATNPGRRYAVRSSAAAEDSPEQAHAGEFRTELDVAPDDLAASISRVIASGARQGAMAAVVQEMITPVLSGVVFTRNPVTGLSDVVVEALRGRGDELLEGGGDPLRWISRNGSLVEEPEGEGGLRPLIDAVVAESLRLSDAYGPADLEWVWDGTELWWVQIRPITAISDVPVYSRRIAKDVLPGLIKPLVWSVNIPMVNTAWVRLFTQAVGRNELDPDALARSFAYRAYFDMRPIGDIFELVNMPRDSLEILLGLPGEKGRMRPGLGTLARLPRLASFGVTTLLGGRDRDRRRELLQSIFETYARSPVTDLSDAALVAEIEELQRLGVEAAYLNIVVPVLANLATAILKRRLGAAGYEYEDLEPLTGDAWDPGPSVRRLGEAVRALGPGDRAAVERGDLSALDEAAAARLDRVLTEFGHLSESSNDLSMPRWRDDPSVVLRLASVGSGEAPRERMAWRDLDAVLTGRRRRGVRRWERRARRSVARRDAVASTFTYGYGLLRPRFLEVGRRLVRAGVLEEPEDAFYVPQRDLHAALRELPGDGLAERAQAVRTDMAAVADLIMPDIIVGDAWVPESPRVSSRLTGVGTSRGRYRGTARFIESLSEANRLAEGDVLVVEHSDVAWTPLFGRAGAVVAATGGMLAHSSITAREMGVPCVASVSKARLLDGALVVVDGSTGDVIVESGAEVEATETR